MTYLIVAYAFAVALLGGFLAWSLRRMRELERLQRGPREPKAKPAGSWGIQSKQ